MSSGRALVTGGAGFIGSHIVDALERKGYEVWVLDDLSTGSAANIRGAAHLVKADVRKISGLEGLPRDLDVVFHEAAIASVPFSVDEPMTVHDVNVNASLEVMNFCVERRIRRFIFASSAAVYGRVENPPAREGDYAAPSSPYGASKLAVENYMHAFHASYGLETVALRYFNVYGPRQRADDDYSGVITLFARQMLSSMVPTIFGDGLQTRDFVNVADIAAANVLAMESSMAPGRVFNIATGQNVSILHLLEVLAKVSGSGEVTPKFAPPRKGDVRVGSASIDRAREVLGFEPRVSLDEGLAGVVKYIGSKLGVLAA